MKNIVLGLFTIALMIFSPNLSAQKTVNGIKFSSTFKVDGKNLVWNGSGIRKKYFFKVYSGVLYTPSKTTNASSLLSKNVPLAFKMGITSSLLTTEKMKEAMEDGFSRSTKNASSALKAQVKQFINKMAAQTIKKGDIFTIYYSSSSGYTKVLKGTSVIYSVKGKAFRDAIFGIWLGSDPVDAGLKKNLMKGS